MMFLVRSAFWLGVVYSSMPWDRGEALRAADQVQATVVAGAVAAAKAKCVADIASCRAIVGAAGAVVAAANAEPTAPLRGLALRGTLKAQSAQPSTDTLTPTDLATPWRGRPVKSGA